MKKFIFVLVVLVIGLAGFCVYSIVGGNPQPQKLPVENTQGELQEKLDTNVNEEWHRTNVHSATSAKLFIKNVTDTGFDFSFEAFYWSHTGFFHGQAEFVEENRAISSKIIDMELPEYEFAQLEFIFENGTITIPEYDFDKGLPVGAMVSVHGEYTKDEPVYTNADNYRKVVPNDRVAAIIEDLLGEDMYHYFEWAAHDGDPEPCQVEGYPGYKIETRTMGGIAFRIAVTEDDKVFLWQEGFGEESIFYTNS